jgi:hypothetical protein
MLKRKINPSTGETKPGRSRVRSHSVITARPCLHKKRFTPDTHKKKSDQNGLSLFNSPKINISI